MTKREDVLAAHAVVKPKVDAAIEAVQNASDDDDSWKQAVEEALPAMQAFQDAVLRYAVESLRPEPPEPQDPNKVVNGILRDLGQKRLTRPWWLRWWPW